MVGSFKWIGGGMVQVQPGRMSLGRFYRETVALGQRRRMTGWTVWAQPLLPDTNGLTVRCEGGLVSAQGGSPLWIAMDGPYVVIRSGGGRRPVSLPTQALAALVSEVLIARRKAQVLLTRFWEVLEQGDHPDRAVRGAIIQVRRILRQGGSGLTRGLLRQVWKTLEVPFGTACLSVADKAKVNPGRVRVILTRYAAWWPSRKEGAPHWLDGLVMMLGYRRELIAACVTANKWYHLCVVSSVYIYVSVLSSSMRESCCLTGQYRYIVDERGTSYPIRW